MKNLKTLNLGKIQIHFYPTDYRVVEIGIALSTNYIELQLIFWCIEIDW